MTYLVGIDGGGSGCRAVVAAPDGRVLGRGEAGPANVATDLSGAVSNILLATGRALDRAGHAAPLHDLRAGLGLAGANSGDVVAALRERLPFRRCRIATDGETAVRGALGAADGIVAAIGTGSVLAARRSGKIRFCGGWGFALGDEGSGARIGQLLLSHALQVADGRRRPTDLLTDILQEMGGPAAVVAFSLSARPQDFASLAPRVIASQDPAAVEIQHKSVSDIAEMIVFLQREGPLPVVFVGGLAAFYQSHLADRWPVRAPVGTPLDGALLLAQEAA